MFGCDTLYTPPVKLTPPKEALGPLAVDVGICNVAAVLLAFAAIFIWLAEG